MLLLIPSSFLYLFLFYTFFILSFYRVLYNLYLNSNLLKILSNYTYTISKVTTLHTYILTSCLIFFTHFYLSYFSFISIFLHISTFPYSFFFFFFILFFLLYFSSMHFHHTFLLFLHIFLLCLI